MKIKPVIPRALAKRDVDEAITWYRDENATVSPYTDSVLNFILVGIIDGDGAFQPRSGAWSI